MRFYGGGKFINISEIKSFILIYIFKFKEFILERNSMNDEGVKDDFSVYSFMNNFI